MSTTQPASGSIALSPSSAPSLSTSSSMASPSISTFASTSTTARRKNTRYEEDEQHVVLKIVLPSWHTDNPRAVVRNRDACPRIRICIRARPPPAPEYIKARMVFVTLVPSSCGSWDAAAAALSVRRGYGGYADTDFWTFGGMRHLGRAHRLLHPTSSSLRLRHVVLPPPSIHPPHPVLVLFLVPDLRPSVHGSHRTCDSLPPQFPAHLTPGAK
ncbi:hypothetical protein K438DRAFT_2023221, partial [Mycena galopus ATCC 62051]